MKNKILCVAAGSLLVFWTFACFNRQPQAAPAKKLTIFVSILPQKYFVERITQDLADIQVLVPSGKNPETYEITAKQITALSRAQVFFPIGIGFEEVLVPKLRQNLPALKIVLTDQGIFKRHFEDHDHETAEKRTAEDPHIWLSPLLVKKQAQTIYETLLSLYPEGAAVFKQGYDSFISDLDTLHRQITALLKPYAGQMIFVYHPAFGYFTDAYGLVQRAVEIGGKEPTPASLMEIIAYVQEHHVKVMFVQPEFPEDSVRAISQAIHGQIIRISPLEEDYINNMLAIARQIKEGFDK